MGTETLKAMKEQLMSCVQNQLNDISKADTHELGEAVDMIKDLAEAIYYCTITDSMEKVEDKEKTPVNNITYYTNPTPMYYKQYSDPYRDTERNNGYMYYTPNNGGSSNNLSYYPEMMRDPREGRSPMRRRMYMEGKEKHKDATSQLQELQAYLQQLSTDITEMIKDASPEERATLRQKMTTLANKIN